MILDQIAWVDCIAFLLFLAPQLLIQIGLFPTIFCALKALPFLRKAPNAYLTLPYILTLIIYRSVVKRRHAPTYRGMHAFKMIHATEATMIYL